MKPARLFGCAVIVRIGVAVCIGQGGHGQVALPPKAPAIKVYEPRRLTATELAGIRVADRKNNLADAAALVEIARAMQARIEKESPWVVSVKTVKDTGEIQRLTKRIRERLKND